MNIPIASGLGDREKGRTAALEWCRASHKKILIGGKWVESVSGGSFETIDPSTEELLTRVAAADAADVDLAVLAARRAFEDSSWSAITPHRRTRYLLDIADAIDRHAPELAALETLDNGGTITFTTGMVAKVAEIFRYYAGWPTKIYGTTNPSDPSRFIYMLREPMGVCGLINAWNGPLLAAATKIAPALACGNTVVLKPAELTPLTTIRLAELIEAVGMPAGVVNIVPGAGSKAGAAIAAHNDIDKVSFTGSTGVGRQILHASTGNMKKVTLELGGKSPNIIFPDADLDRAIEASALAFCRNSGQICSAGTRLFVQKEIYDQVVERVANVAAGYKVGSPFEPDTNLGPLISLKQMSQVLDYVESGKREGASLNLGGSRVGNTGFFVQPTVFAQVDPSMTIAREEIFGPVLSVIPFDDENDAILKGNATEFGLAAAVWTGDIGRAHRVAGRLKSGRVWINTYGETDVVMSMGGYKQSGYGREMGSESIDAFTQTKSVLMRL